MNLDSNDGKLLQYSRQPLYAWQKRRSVKGNIICKKCNGVIRNDEKKKKIVKKRKYLHTCTRIFWFISIVTCIGGCLFQSVSFLRNYYEYPTVTETIVENIGEVDFPGVTLCNYNKVLRSKWCKQGEVNICDQLQNESYSDFKDRLESMYRSLTVEERIQLGPQKSGFVKMCKYNGKKCLDKVYSFFDYHFTNCFTFNAQWGNKTPVSKAVGWDPLDDKLPTFLRLWIDFQDKEYIPLQPRTLGKVVIHKASNLPNPEWNGLNIEPGFFYKIKIQQITTELLPAPYQTDCINYSEFPPDMRSNARLDQESCVDECLLNYTLNICGCTFIRLALSYNVQMCESEEVLIEKSCDKNDKLCLCYAKKEAAKHCPSLCKLACKQVKYEEKGLEILNWPGSIGKISKYYNYTNLTEAKKTVASVQVFFTTMETTIRKYQPKYHFVEIFSYLGGFIGLWLGVSLLNIFEYIKDEALCIARFVRKIKNRSFKRSPVVEYKEY